MLLCSLAASLAALSLLLLVWQFLAAIRFPLHRRIGGTAFTPAVSVLKPIKGCDETTIASLRSWLEQEHTGAVQTLFGMQDAMDPSAKAIRRLLEEFPTADASLVVCPNARGTNPKVSLLAQLLPLARHEVIVLSDADVRAPRDLLTNLVAPLADQEVGLAHCFYRLANPTTTAMRWEAVSTNVDFWSQVLQARSLWRPDFGLGAAMALRREQLDVIGGLASLGDFLADDFHLGRLVVKSGRRIEFCPVVVECWEAPRTWTETWRHQLRWARTIRRCRPVGFGFSILANVTLWAVLFAAVCPGSAGIGLGIASILLRILLGGLLQHRLGDPKRDWAWCWMIPVKDLLGACLWFAAFAGNTVIWREVRYFVTRDGRLKAVPRP